MNSPDDNCANVLLEEIRAQNKAVLKMVGDMQQKVAVLPVMQADIAELKQDAKVIKAAVTDLSHQVNNHEQRISRLEAA